MTTTSKTRVFTEEEVGKIYEKCLDFLSNSGVVVNHPGALKLLGKAGAQVDFGNQHVRFPKNLIEESLSNAARSMILASSNRQHDAVIPHPKGLFYTRNNTGSPNYVEPGTNNYRGTALADVAEWGQLTEVLDDIDMTAILSPTDVPEQTGDIHSLKTILENTSKHITIQPWGFDSIEHMINLATTVAGSAENLRKRPTISIFCVTTTPFVYKDMDAEVIIQCCRHGIPLLAQSLPCIGATSPITPAGSVLVAGIEVLAIVVMSQLIKPGTPVIGCSAITTVDMLTGGTVVSDIDSILSSVGFVQFIKDMLNIPAYTLGFGTDSYIPDGQAMMETTLRGLMVAMAGCDILISAGRLNSAKAVSPIELILDNTLARILKRAIQGIDVSDDSLAWSEILNTAPGGHFLDTVHTLKHCRDALRNELLTNQPYEAWKEEGSKDLYARAFQKYSQLKKKLKPLELPKEVKVELDRIVKHADENLVK